MGIDYDVEKTHCVREWLCPNDPHVGSSIRAHVTSYPKVDINVDEYAKQLKENKKKGKGTDIRVSTEISSDVTLTDCNRAITWNFSIYASTEEDFKKQVEQNLDKLNRFKRALQEWEDAYRQAIADSALKQNEIVQEITDKLNKEKQ